MRCSNDETRHKNGRESNYIQILRRRKEHFSEGLNLSRSRHRDRATLRQSDNVSPSRMINDAVRGKGTLQKALQALQLLQAQGLPEAFADTVLTGWWTTCLQVLPGKELGRERW